MTLTIVLDLDDTLYLERDYVGSGFIALSQWVQDHLGLAGFGEIAWRLWQNGQRKQTFDEALRTLGASPEEGLIEQMLSVYREHRPKIALQPDAASFLSTRRGFRTALVTDGPVASQRAKIAALDLPRFGIDPLICTDEWGRAFWKPHRRAFETIAQLHGAGDRRFIYVADNPAKDFLAPRALGWGAVQIDRPGAIHPRNPPSEEHRAHLHIQSFHDLDEETLGALIALSPWRAS